jgi:hypothetical protein
MLNKSMCDFPRVRRCCSHAVTMAVFCFDVNCANDEKLVPLTRHNGASIRPAAEAIVLKRVEEYFENGPLREHEAIDIQLMIEVSPG